MEPESETKKYHQKAVVLLDSAGAVVRTYRSGRDAALDLGVPPSQVKRRRRMRRRERERKRKELSFTPLSLSLSLGILECGNAMPCVPWPPHKIIE